MANKDYISESQNMLMPILRKHNTIGLMLSGGLDSAVLLCLMIELMQKHRLDNKIVLYTVHRTDNSATHAYNVSQHVQRKYGVKLKHKPAGTSEVPHTIQTWSGCVKAIKETDIVLTADNAVPDHLIAEHSPQRRRAKIIAQPFFDVYKDFIVGLAIQMNLTDIMEITHTCTETQDIRCSECWQCKERAWAFAEHSYTDPGNL